MTQSGSIRKEARAKGEKTYHGKECAHHPGTTEKWTSNGACVACTRAALSAYRERNKEGMTQKRREWTQKNPVKTMLQRARRRAREMGLEFDLTPDSVVIPEACPALGIILERAGECQDNSPSLDRKDNSKGYVVGNVEVISFRANRIKNNASLEELKRIVQYYEQ